MPFDKRGGKHMWWGSIHNIHNTSRQWMIGKSECWRCEEDDAGKHLSIEMGTHTFPPNAETSSHRLRIQHHRPVVCVPSVPSIVDEWLPGHPDRRSLVKNFAADDVTGIRMMMRVMVWYRNQGTWDHRWMRQCRYSHLVVVYASSFHPADRWTGIALTPHSFLLMIDLCLYRSLHVSFCSIHPHQQPVPLMMMLSHLLLLLLVTSSGDLVSEFRCLWLCVSGWRGRICVSVFWKKNVCMSWCFKSPDSTSQLTIHIHTVEEQPVFPVLLLCVYFLCWMKAVAGDERNDPDDDVRRRWREGEKKRREEPLMRWFQPAVCCESHTEWVDERSESERREVEFL